MGGRLGGILHCLPLVSAHADEILAGVCNVGGAVHHLVHAAAAQTVNIDAEYMNVGKREMDEEGRRLAQAEKQAFRSIDFIGA